MRKLSLFLFVLLCIQQVTAQIHYQPYSFQHYQRYGKAIYGDSIAHTAVKPFVGKQLDAAYEIVPRDSTRGWLHRKIFQEHLIEVLKDEHSFYADFLPDFVIGRQTGTNDKNLWTNSRGIQAGLNVKDKFALYFSFFETQARFPTHIDSAAVALGGLSGQGFSKNINSQEFDWMNTSVNMNYHVSDGFQVSLAYDKLHIGDGYRSVLLSDNPYNFTHAKFSGKVKRFQYNSIWAYMLDRRNPRYQILENQERIRVGNASKYAAFQYIDYLASDKLTVGLFHSLIWSRYSDANAKKVNGGVGLNVKYQPWDKYVFYGQFFADDLSKLSFNKNSDRRTAYQLGARAFDLFAVDNLNLTAEFNQAAPHTYQHSNNRLNYSSDGDPLAHPNGANFRELLGIATYRWKRFDVYGQTMFARYGLDPMATDNFGRDIFKSEPASGGFRIGQGQAVDLFYNELRVAYMLNPKYNLRWELGLINRQQKPISAGDRINATIFTIGLRSSFRTFQTEY